MPKQIKHELLCIEWPEGEETGRGHVLEVFFKFCDDNAITVGQQIIILSLFEAAGADLGAVISEQHFTDVMERMKERSNGRLNYDTMEGYSDQ
jgi:hypothetical protein